MKSDIIGRIEHFFNSYREVHYPKEQILIFPDDTIDKVFHITQGRVCQYSISYRGDEIIVNSFKSPAFFPMAMAINQTPSNFFYKAETDATVRTAPVADVITFLHDNPDVTFDLLSRVYVGVESVLVRMVHLMSGTAKTRLIFEILVEFRRFANKTGRAGYLTISEAGIAARSGLSRETVNREIKHLKEKGLIEFRSHQLYIANIDKLAEQIPSHI